MLTGIAKRQRMGVATVFLAAVGLAVVMSGVWFFGAPRQAHACKCVEPGSPAEELEKFSAVFAGEVVWIEHSYDPGATSVSPEDFTIVGFEVSTVWKGTVYEEMYITTPPIGGSCGFTFIEGEKYIVYAHDSPYGDSGYTVGICSRTALLGQAGIDLDALGDGRPPRAGTGESLLEYPPDSFVRWAWGIILAVAAVVIPWCLFTWPPFF